LPKFAPLFDPPGVPCKFAANLQGGFAAANFNSLFRTTLPEVGVRGFDSQGGHARCEINEGMSTGENARTFLAVNTALLVDRDWTKRLKMGSFERRSAGKCSRDRCKKCNLRCNLHYLHQGKLNFVIYLLTCTPPTFFRNPISDTPWLNKVSITTCLNS